MVTTASNGFVTVEVTDRYAHVQLNRPDRMNALTREVFEDLVEIGTGLFDNTEVAAVVFTGAGRAFSAGLDFEAFQAMSSGETSLLDPVEPVGASKAVAQQAAHVWSLIEVPVIAGVHGVAYGGGLQICLGADLRIMSANTKVSMMEINWGLAPDMTGTQVLPQLVGPSQAKYLTFTGEVIDGSRCYQIGLADELAQDPVARALELGAEIADKSRSALVWSKKLIDMSSTATLEEGLAAEQMSIRELAGSPEQLQAAKKRLTQLENRG